MLNNVFNINILLHLKSGGNYTHHNSHLKCYGRYYTPPPPGGGGYFHMYAYWVCAAKETLISAPNFQKNPFRNITIFHFLADFAVPETIIFKISLISTRSSPLTAGSARTQRRVLAVSESPIFSAAVQPARPASSGESHFHAKMDQACSGAPTF